MGTTPRLRAAPPSSRGGSTGTASTAEQLIRTAHVVLAEAGVQMGPRKVSRLVRQFEAHVERNGWSFADFLFNAIALSNDRRQELLANAEVARSMAYLGPRRDAARLDPTGDQAVRNILRRSA